MAKNRITKKVALSSVNTWVQVPVADTGKAFVVRTVQNTDNTATIEVALSVAAPAGAGSALEVGVATECQIQNAATHTLWVRATNAAAVGALLEVDPLVNGNVLTATA